MSTLGDMKARIALEIVRNDLAVQIANAITDAIEMYQGDRFYFNEPTLLTEPTWNTVIGRATYGFADSGDIKSGLHIDFLTYVQGGTTFTITRRSVLEVQQANQLGLIAGPPDIYCYAGQTIALSPVPDQVYPISMFGHLVTAAPVSDVETNNPWMNDAEMLIRCRAKFELATHVTRNDKMATAMSPDVDGGPGGHPGATFRAWSDLKDITTKKKSLGRIQAMPF